MIALLTKLNSRKFAFGVGFGILTEDLESIAMTKLLDEAIEKVRSLPDDRQNEAAGVLLTVVGKTVPELTEKQIAGVHEAIAEADSDDLVDKTEIDKVFAKHLT